jgi:hypothetical protein
MKIHEAARNGDLEKIKELLKKNPIWFSEKTATRRLSTVRRLRATRTWRNFCDSMEAINELHSNKNLLTTIKEM